MTRIPKEILDTWRSDADKAMHSAMDEYVPKDEFFQLVEAYVQAEQEVEALLTAINSAGLDEGQKGALMRSIERSKAALAARPEQP